MDWDKGIIVISPILLTPLPPKDNFVITIGQNVGVLKDGKKVKKLDIIGEFRI